MKRKLWINLIAASSAAWGLAAYGADHAESPTVTADPAADIADVFIFRPDQAQNRVVVAVTFAGRPSTAAGGTRIDGPTLRCDRNVLYVFNIDNNADGNLDSQPDLQVLARLGRNGNDQCGVRIEGIPGASAPLSGPAETILTAPGSGLRAYAGLVDDPFFFDSMGFGATLASFAADGPSGQLGFMNTRDSFGGRNLSVIVFEMDLAAAAGGDATANPILQFWGETRRFPGTTP